MQKRLNYLLLLAFTLLIHWAEAQSGKKPIVTSDLMKIVTSSQLEVSPDTKKAVMVVTKRDQKGEDYFYSHNLYMLDLEKGGEPIQLTFGKKSDSQPTWAPDGEKIAFVRAEEGKSQIWILPLTGGEAYPFTTAKHGASGPSWSPDGGSILFSSNIPDWDTEGTPTWDSERPGREFKDEPNWKALKEEEKKDIKSTPDGDLAELRAWLAKNAVDKNPRVFVNQDFQAEQGLNPEMKYRHLFIQSLDAEKARQLTKGFQDFGGGDWSPDGKTIVCSSIEYKIEPDKQSFTDLWKIDVASGATTSFLHMEGYSLGNPLFSPDGKSILFYMRDDVNRHATQNDLGLVNTDGSGAKMITAAFDRDASGPVFSPDNKKIYFTASSEGDIPLYSYDLKKGEIVTILEGDKGVNDFALAGKKIIMTITDFTNPMEVYSMDTKSGALTALTRFNTDWLKDKIITPLSEHWITRPDGTKVQYWVMQPVGFKQGVKYPTVLEIHGGPSAMWGPSGLSMWHEFQLLASWGYGVVFSNPRGSGGYGDSFKKGNYRDWGHGPANDILAALDDATSKNSWMDTDQLFVTGGSYAGYMVAWLVTQDHRFKAANAQRGVYDLTTFMGEGNAWRLVPTHFGYPWEDGVQEILDANSPITFIDEITTPLLIMHSDQDLRTGTIQSEMMYKSLKALDRPVEYVRYPGEGHELSRSGNPLRMMDRLGRFIEFFERYVKHPEAPAATVGED
jgi:dipeptidyl aminopeptidase/acylaminoacyl peptidase